MGIAGLNISGSSRLLVESSEFNCYVLGLSPIPAGSAGASLPFSTFKPGGATLPSTFSTSPMDSARPYAEPMPTKTTSLLAASPATTPPATSVIPTILPFAQIARVTKAENLWEMTVSVFPTTSKWLDNASLVPMGVPDVLTAAMQ